MIHELLDFRFPNKCERRIIQYGGGDRNESLPCSKIEQTHAQSFMFKVNNSPKSEINFTQPIAYIANIYSWV